MKKILFLVLALLAGIFILDAAAFQKSGKLSGHNYIQLNKWTFDSLKVGTSDSVVLLLDSATSTPFTTATLGRVRSPQASEYDRLPDSVGFLITWAGEADAVSIRVNYLVSMLGASGPWVAVGTPDTLTMTGATRATAVTSIPVARKFYPNAHHKVEVKTTTATDTARLYDIQAQPVYR